MKTRTILAIVLAVLLVGWMSLIYVLSCEDGEQSKKTSTDVATDISEIIMPADPTEDIEKNVEQHQKLIRKSAHFLLYAVLGFLTVAFVSTITEMEAKQKLLLSFSFSGLYAATDELHQYFVTGRSGMSEDICLDFSSALLAIVLFIAVQKLYYFLKNKKRRVS